MMLARGRFSSTAGVYRCYPASPLGRGLCSLTCTNDRYQRCPACGILTCLGGDVGMLGVLINFGMERWASLDPEVRCSRRGRA